MVVTSSLSHKTYGYICIKLLQLTEEGEIARKIADRSYKSTISKGRLNVKHGEKHVNNGKRSMIK